MKSYTAYKQWWIDTQLKDSIVLHYCVTVEDAFKQHVNDLGLYGLMETMVRWSDE
jgi:hypothetical protein